VTTWGAISNEILALREHLVAEKVTCVVMESTGDYRKPFYYLLEDAVNVTLVHPARRPPPAGPQNGRQRCCMAGRPRRTRSAAGLAGPATTDPAVT
jgi:hypothetical protein